MKTLNGLLLFAIIFIAACNNNNASTENIGDSDSSNSVNPKDWKFGIALWTFHDVNFEKALERTDSAGLVYIEPNTFTAAGGDLKDAPIYSLSSSDIDKLKAMIASKGLKVESLYVVGDSTINSWKKQFDIARQLGVEFVTTEPPLDMWDSLDSLAGAYGIKVAIHEHWNGFSHYWNLIQL